MTQKLQEVLHYQLIKQLSHESREKGKEEVLLIFYNDLDHTYDYYFTKTGYPIIYIYGEDLFNGKNETFENFLYCRNCFYQEINEEDKENE